jgi:hypothetical protein
LTIDKGVTLTTVGFTPSVDTATGFGTAVVEFTVGDNVVAAEYLTGVNATPVGGRTLVKGAGVHYVVVNRVYASTVVLGEATQEVAKL